MTLKSPYPWFGGKALIAHRIWELLGDVPNFVDPFFGGNAVLLARPTSPQIETINDKDGFVCNFWRAVQAVPEHVAQEADWPSNENDLHARHVWLVGQKDSLQASLEGDPLWYDARIAGWWVWGMACWIGGAFCSGKGPWHVVDGQLVKDAQEPGNGVERRLTHLSPSRGVNRQRIHLSHDGQGVQRRRIHLGEGGGTGVHRKALEPSTGLREWMVALQQRLRRVRVCCGEWHRLAGPIPTFYQGLTGMVLDPPYSASTGRTREIYRMEDGNIAQAVAAWAQEWGTHPLMRIVLCGYIDEHPVLAESGWRVEPWTAHGGYSHIGDGPGKDNRFRECLYISPNCLRDTQMALW